MTRRKKSKSAASSNGASAVPAPAQVATSLQDGTDGPEVAYVVPTCPRTGYSLLAPRPVYPVLVTRPVQSLPTPRSTHLSQGPRPAFASNGPRPVQPVTALRPVTASHPVTTPRTETAPRNVAASQSGSDFRPGAALKPGIAVSSGTNPRPMTEPQVANPRQVSQVEHKAVSENLRVKSSTVTGPVINPSDRSVGNITSSHGSSTRSEETSSIVSVASTKTSDAIDKKKRKKPYKVKVTYETKEVNIYPRQPILMVERLQNLEYHVGMLTEALGRRPAVYPLGRRVRFVPETAAEGATIQRYLARIEAQERIAWCSYSLPPGNSLKVTVKVKVVERIEITDDLAKLNLQGEKNEGPGEAIPKDTEAKEESAILPKQNGKKDKLTTSSSVKKDDIKKQGNSTTVKQTCTSSSGQVEIKAQVKQVAHKDKPVAFSPVQNTKVNDKTKMTKKSAIKTGPIRDNVPKKSVETEKTAAAVKTVHERDNKLRIVGVVRTNKMF